MKDKKTDKQLISLIESKGIISFGPKKAISNILIINTNIHQDYLYNIINGFLQACLAGPLCEEPI